MTDASSTPFVAALCLLAVLMSFVLVRRLKRRERATLRASVVAFMWGLAGAELALLPAFVAALTTDGVLGLRHSDTDSPEPDEKLRRLTDSMLRRPEPAQAVLGIRDRHRNAAVIDTVAGPI